MKKLFVLFVFLFLISIFISVNSDFNSKTKVTFGVEEVSAYPPIAPPPR